MDNAKNRLHELIKDLGHYEKCVSFQDTHDLPNGKHISQAILTVNDGRVITGNGVGETKKAAQIEACADVMAGIDEDHRDLRIDWTQIKVEAQAGDCLIKLCAYLAEDMPSAEDKSIWLQEMESDSHMVDIFDNMHEANHPLVIIFGKNLGAKKKATWIEALIWRRFGAEIIAPSSGQAFEKIADFLGGKTHEIETDGKQTTASHLSHLMSSLYKMFSIKRP